MNQRMRIDLSAELANKFEADDVDLAVVCL